MSNPNNPSRRATPEQLEAYLLYGGVLQDEDHYLGSGEVTAAGKRKWRRAVRVATDRCIAAGLIAEGDGDWKIPDNTTAPLKVTTQKTASGTYARIVTAKRDVSVLLENPNNVSGSLRRDATEAREKAARLIAYAETLERAADTYRKTTR